MSHEVTYDKMFYDLGNGEWNVPALRTLLEQVIPEHTTVEDYEVVHEFISLGNRTMLVNACEIRYENGRKKMLLSIDDITDKRNVESELKKLIEQKNILLTEMRHRIANSLQLIASILLIKAGTIESEEARLHLEDAHGRIMSIATVQQHLDPAGLIADRVEVGPYLTGLCESLAASMVGGRRSIVIKVTAGAGSVSSEQAISFGLVTTELVINALKYAFPRGEGCIDVTFEATDPGWILTIKDDGVGYIKNVENQGLGTSIVASLAKQLGADLTAVSNSRGTCVSLAYPAAKLF